MDFSVKDRGIYAFGGFQLDPLRRTLSRNGVPVKLVQRLFDTLLYLVENPGRIVEKDELLGAVWGGRIVEEANLTRAISELRKLLQVEGTQDNLIVTAPGRGYRFAAEVVQVGGSPEVPGMTALRDAAQMSAASDATVETVTTQRRGRFAWRIALAAAAVAACVALAWRMWPVGTTPSPAEAAFQPPPRSVAVMAFTNTTGDPAQAYFSDGISEELIDALSRIEALEVAARTSAFSFRDGHATVAEIGRRLNVGAVLEGSVRRGGGRLRINADLVDTVSGFMLWHRSYESDSNDVLKLQTDIAAAVVGALRVQLGAADTARLTLGGTQDPQAYDNYLRGMRLLRANGEGDDEQARAVLQQAVAQDPNYALAHQALSKAIRFLAANDNYARDPARVQNLLRLSMAEADRAIALAPTLASGYAARANALEVMLDFRGAYQAIQHAAELGPGDASVQLYYGQFATRIGHSREGLAAVARGVRLDPLATHSYLSLAVVNYADQRYDDALAAVQHLQSLTGHMPRFATQIVAAIALQRGDPAKAAALCADPSDFQQIVYRAMAEHALGHQAEAEAAMARLRGLMGTNGNYQYAQVYAQWGQPLQAMAALTEAFRLRDPGLADALSDHFLDPLRDRPDFRDLLRQLTFPD
jgi:TolB-like protein/DNA-binding winged helix-turn-helix (wHTH) protein